MNTYGYIISHGVAEDSLNLIIVYIIFADTKETADRWIKDEIEQSIEQDKSNM